MLDEIQNDGKHVWEVGADQIVSIIIQTLVNKLVGSAVSVSSKKIVSLFAEGLSGPLGKIIYLILSNVKFGTPPTSSIDKTTSIIDDIVDDCYIDILNILN